MVMVEGTNLAEMEKKWKGKNILLLEYYYWDENNSWGLVNSHHVSHYILPSHLVMHILSLSFNGSHIFPLQSQPATCPFCYAL